MSRIGQRNSKLQLRSIITFFILCAKLSRMSTTDILSLIDAEISRLEEARALIAAFRDSRYTTTATVKPKDKKKGTMSPEGRARVAKAQRERWAKQKKAAK